MMIGWFDFKFKSAETNEVIFELDKEIKNSNDNDDRFFEWKLRLIIKFLNNENLKKLANHCFLVEKEINKSAEKYTGDIDPAIVFSLAMQAIFAWIDSFRFGFKNREEWESLQELIKDGTYYANYALLYNKSSTMIGEYAIKLLKEQEQEE